MSNTVGPSPMPVFNQDGTSVGPSPLSPAVKDPLYAALIGGNIGTPNGMVNIRQDQNLNTLDEPFSKTLKRDLKMISDKARMIIALDEPDSSLRDWDFWGPLINSLIISAIFGLLTSNSASSFTLMFSLIWLGCAMVVVNCRLLGYRFGLLPAISFIGYSFAPLAVTIILNLILPSFWTLKLLLLLVGCGWSILSSVRLLDADPALEDRKLLATFPIYLLFFLVGWIIMVS